MTDIKLVGTSKSNTSQAVKDLKKNIRDLTNNMDLIAEYHLLSAKIIKARYNALIEEGFTKEQALELCKLII
jgi:hypothetical protein